MPLITLGNSLQPVLAEPLEATHDTCADTSPAPVDVPPSFPPPPKRRKKTQPIAPLWATGAAVSGLAYFAGMIVGSYEAQRTMIEVRNYTFVPLAGDFAAGGFSEEDDIPQDMLHVLGAFQLVGLAMVIAGSSARMPDENVETSPGIALALSPFGSTIRLTY